MSKLGWCITSHHESCPVTIGGHGITPHTCSCVCHEPKDES